jgi:hypothetical protein
MIWRSDKVIPISRQSVAVYKMKLQCLISDPGLGCSSVFLKLTPSWLGTCIVSGRERRKKKTANEGCAGKRSSCWVSQQIQLFLLTIVDAPKPYQDSFIAMPRQGLKGAYFL